MDNFFNNINGSLAAVIAHGALAVFGGLVHALNAHRIGRAKDFGDVLILTVISSFSGVIFALLALYVVDNLYFTLAAAGSGGFLGVEGLTVLARKVQDVISKK